MANGVDPDQKPVQKLSSILTVINTSGLVKYVAMKLCSCDYQNYSSSRFYVDIVFLFSSPELKAHKVSL